MQHPALETIQTTISSLAPGGSGVTHVEHGGERRAVFVPHSAPGDHVRVAVDLSVRPARGSLLEILSPGPDRIAPACRWSSRCGGCDWMHLSLQAQARAHLDHLRAALPAAWRNVPIETHAAVGEDGLGYRARTRVHVRCGRSGKAVVGMHGAGTHDPVEVDTCAVLQPALEGARRGLAALFEGNAGRAEVQIALGAGGRPVLDVRWSGHVAAACFARIERAVAGGALAGARLTIDEARRPANIGDPTPWMRGADGEPLRLAPGGFGQANDAMNAALALHVEAVARQAPVKKAVELYAGAGNLSVVLARAAGDLVCVESSREGCDAARANLTARGLGARVIEADADSYAWKASTDLVVLDPPRTGARVVAGRLATSRVARIIYVSCDAQTLGRDLALLEPGFLPVSLATFEMFPQTSHVEAVVALQRRPRDGAP
jgi:23S rRNA (uracil1939-C5)-methyltransferase